MAALLVALALLGVGTQGCSSTDGPDAPVAGPALANGGSPVITQGVTGRVIDDGGQPVARALVQPRSLDTNGPPIPEIAVFSDPNGQYVWRLSPGRYEFSVSTSGYQRATARVIVNTSQLTTLDFTLKRVP